MSNQTKDQANEGLMEGRNIADSDASTLAPAHACTRDLPKWQIEFIEAFVAALRKKPIVSHAIDTACAAAGQGISRKTAYRWREEDEAFREAWDDALESGWDNAEAEAYRRAVEGTLVPIVSRKSGEIVGHATEYSDRLLELLLKGNRAEKYREKTSPLININVGQTEDAVAAALKSGTLERFFGRKLTEKGSSLQ